MCTFLFRKEHCRIWNRCNLAFVNYVNLQSFPPQHLRYGVTCVTSKYCKCITHACSLLANEVIPVMVSTVRFHDRDALYGSPNVINCRIPKFSNWIFDELSGHSMGWTAAVWSKNIQVKVVTTTVNGAIALFQALCPHLHFRIFWCILGCRFPESQYFIIGCYDAMLV